LLDLINQVLDLSKIEAGKMELETSAVSLDLLVKGTLSQMEGRVLEKEVKLLADLPEEINPFETDPGKLKQVIINLVGNALKFTEHGSVTVRVKVEPVTLRPLRIDVVDTGIGIPKDRQTAIFEAFQQADNTTSRKYGGTGLGLTISKTLCEGHGVSHRSRKRSGQRVDLQHCIDRGETGASPADTGKRSDRKRPKGRRSPTTPN